jgi:hypothetical protein
MKKIIVIPAGRKRYLEILLKYLIAYKNEFDELRLWLNTENKDDIDYMVSMSNKYDFITTQEAKIPRNGCIIYHYFKECIDENAVYLRLDDDIVFIERNAINKIFEFRINNPDYFLVYGNIINNAIISHLHQRKGLLPKNPFISYSALSEIGWKDPKYGEIIHNLFIEKINKNEIDNYYLDNWILLEFERVSINVISFLGKDFKEFNGNVGINEELWLSCDKPKELNRPNIIFGKSIFTHYAFFTQRIHLDNTDVLKKYNDLCLNIN